MREPMIFDDWTVTDEDGFVCDVREDAPEEVKKPTKNIWLNLKK